MTEAEQRRQESPLLSDRGVTTIKDSVVARIAGMAAGEVEGVHMGGSASRSAGGLLEGITGSESSTRGVSVEVGSVEAAIDLKMGIDYGKNILGTVGEVRQKITERVQTITGLNVTELNVTISDVTFPENGQESTKSEDSRSSTRTDPGYATRTLPRRELRPGASERETTEVEPRSRSYIEGSSGSLPDEEVRAEGVPVEEDETRRLRVGDEEPSGAETRGEETATAPASEAPTDETTLTGGTSSGERAARETAASESSAGGTEEIDRERVSEAEERRARRRRRREERGENEEG
ncbi:MAG: hypothetical protein AVDCRST_MAG03-3705 [uncultured Rubrobacteraceae bacterium]|uniref:Alkaline shock protein 23 n=1 Tax=uncultured Rubrobacteraceae bacterium TaxID=349277 RepID=A0A6J4QD33_9ACTN|nr:MAG: hypothetical protein AVDCRST_MAG03-3705 [uncultured Rubrobacteraceae bacterium]